MELPAASANNITTVPGNRRLPNTIIQSAHALAHVHALPPTVLATYLRVCLFRPIVSVPSGFSLHCLPSFFQFIVVTIFARIGYATPKRAGNKKVRICCAFLVYGAKRLRLEICFVEKAEKAEMETVN